MDRPLVLVAIAHDPATETFVGAMRVGTTHVPLGTRRGSLRQRKRCTRQLVREAARALEGLPDAAFEDAPVPVALDDAAPGPGGNEE